ncbi:MAG: vWA domain-containing protein, partial [Planctomycetota bacterium]
PDPAPPPPPPPAPDPGPDPAPVPEEPPPPPVAPPPPQAPPPPTPEPAAVAPVNSALALDDGAGDAAEFKSLNEKTEPDWVARAFSTNSYAEGTKDAKSVRALRFALLDREPLIRAFALRGLARRSIDDLKAWGSKALFERLVTNLAVKKGMLPYVAKAARKLLAALVGKDLGEKPEPWRDWFTKEGAQDFAAVREARPAQAPAQDTAAPRATQEKEIARYFTQTREQGLDAVLCIDVTLSMTDTLARVKAQIRELTSFFTLLGKEAKVPARLGYATYGDEVVRFCPLVENLNEFARAVDMIEIFNDPKDKTVEEGIDKAIKKCFLDTASFKWRPKARKVLVIVGDAPMHEVDEKDCFALVKEQTKKLGFTINSLVCEPPKKYAKWDPHPNMKELASLTNGVATDLTTPEEVITQLLVLLLGSKFEEDVRRFVHAYRDVVPPG